jgi:transposase InsO family protein
MDIHQNARTTPRSRAEIVKRIVERHQPVRVVAQDVGICERTARKWLARHQQEGLAGLVDRSCRPHRSPRVTPAAVVARVEALRRERWTGARIAPAVALSRATVGRILRRLGLARLRDLAPAEPVRRYERAHPGELLHIDIKKLGRIAGIGHRITGDRRHRARGIGWEYVHVAIDDGSRLSYADVLRDERGETVAAFLRRAIQWFARRGVRIERVLSDNGSAYRSRVVAAACQALRVAQRWTRPYRPQTNGKAERLIQTLLREWAYGRPYTSSLERQAALPAWLHYYNWHRRHGGIQGRPPISRVIPADNLLSAHGHGLQGEDRCPQRAERSSDSSACACISPAMRRASAQICHGRKCRHSPRRNTRRFRRKYKDASGE